VAQIPRETVEAIRDRIDIVDVIQRHVHLQQKGSNYVGLCPFHKEKTPSFNVIPAKNIYYCFGCSEGGDVFKFLMRAEGMSFVEAVKELGKAAGVEIPERELSWEERRALRARASLFDVVAAAQDYFQSQLWTQSSGHKARQYLVERGIQAEFARQVGLGWAPDSWSGLTDHLQRAGYSSEQIMEAGLARPGKRQGQPYDAFRGRLMVPIRDRRSRVVAFGGRILEGDGPKYINSPETPLYHKSSVLYGLDMAYKGIQRTKRVLLVEGYFDVLSLLQAGFDQAVATCGTALTPEHVKALRRLTHQIVVITDADAAGSRAAEKMLPMFLEAGMQPWRLQVPDAKDPDEFVQQFGAEAFEKALDQKEPLLEWVIQRKLDQSGYDALSRQRVLDELVPLLAGLPPAVLSRVAALTRVREEEILKRVQRSNGEAPVPQAPPREGWRPHRDVTHLLWLLVHRRDQVEPVLGDLGLEFLRAHEPVHEAWMRLLSGESVPDIADDALDPGVRRTLMAVAARETLYPEEASQQAAMDVVMRLLAPVLEAELIRATRAVETASRRGDRQAVTDSLRARSAAVARQKQIHAARKQGDLDEWKASL